VEAVEAAEAVDVAVEAVAVTEAVDVAVDNRTKESPTPMNERVSSA
jgi:hypothetical protein